MLLCILSNVVVVGWELYSRLNAAFLGNCSWGKAEYVSLMFAESVCCIFAKKSSPWILLSLPLIMQKRQIPGTVCKICLGSHRQTDYTFFCSMWSCPRTSTSLNPWLSLGCAGSKVSAHSSGRLTRFCAKVALSRTTKPTMQCLASGPVSEGFSRNSSQYVHMLGFAHRQTLVWRCMQKKNPWLLQVKTCLPAPFRLSWGNLSIVAATFQNIQNKSNESRPASPNVGCDGLTPLCLQKSIARTQVTAEAPARDFMIQICSNDLKMGWQLIKWFHLAQSLASTVHEQVFVMIKWLNISVQPLMQGTFTANR